MHNNNNNVIESQIDSNGSGNDEYLLHFSHTHIHVYNFTSTNQHKTHSLSTYENAKKNKNIMRITNKAIQIVVLSDIQQRI